MKGDFTRVTFDGSRRYTGVLLQQGRVQLDADANEGTDIVKHLDRTARTDEVGRQGAPWSRDPEAPRDDFAVGVSATDITVGQGRYYVEGLLCENDAEISLTAQADLPLYALPTAEGVYAVYLDVWERHVTADDDPDLREVALGGPDTATRTKLVWQARLVRLEASPAAALNRVSAEAHATWRRLLLGSTAKLKVQLSTSGGDTDPCTVPAASGFRGLENQLYRVEIHEGTLAVVDGVLTTSADRPTYLWSRDNGAVVTRWTDIGEPGELIVESTGPDAVRGFQAGQWVELSDIDHELRRDPGMVLPLLDIEEDTLVFDSATYPVALASFPNRAKIRRWDSPDGPDEAPLVWVDLENGIQIAFERGDDDGASVLLQTGDYWLIPARTAEGTIDWPTEADGITPAAIPPMGPRHHRSLLALVRNVGGAWALVEDCRRRFVPDTEQVHLFLLGGDGQAAMPERWLYAPLRVGASLGQWALPGARVRFTLESGGGALAASDPALGPVSTASELLVETNSDGIAQVFWRLGADPGSGDVPVQRVRVDLLDPDSRPYHLSVVFGANLSVARDVAYDGCDHMPEASTVEDALDTLCDNFGLVYVSGDGQSGLPGATLEGPLMVRVGNGAWGLEGARVRFSLLDPTDASEATPGTQGAITQDSSVGHHNEEIKTTGGRRWSFVRVTGADGFAGAVLTLGGSHSAIQHKVLCELVDAGSNPTGPRVVFYARSRVARDVAFAAGCHNLMPAQTVEAALGLLCENSGLYFAGGDAQVGRTDQVLPVPLMARVANGRWPVKGAFVQFEILNRYAYGEGLSLAEMGKLKGLHLASFGRGSSDTEPGIWYDRLVVKTDADGIAQAQWWLGTSGILERQRVRATLLDENHDPTSMTLLYTATVSNRETRTWAITTDSDTGAERFDLVARGDTLPGILSTFGGFRFQGALREDVSRRQAAAWRPAIEVSLQIPSSAYYMSVILDGDVTESKEGKLTWEWDRDGKSTAAVLARALSSAAAVENSRLLMQVTLRPAFFPLNAGEGAQDIHLHYWVELYRSGEVDEVTAESSPVIFSVGSRTLTAAAASGRTRPSG